VRRADRSIDSLAALSGKRVAAVDGNVAVNILRQRGDVDVVVADHFEQALFALLASEVDALVYPAAWVNRLAQKVGVSDRIKVVGEPLLEVKRAMAVRKGNEVLLRRINAALDSVIHSPEYRSVYRKWYGNPEPYWTISGVAWTTLTIAFIVVLAMGAWHYRSVLVMNRVLRHSVIQQKEAEQAFQESEAQLRLLMDSTYEAIFGVDKQGNCTFANPACLQLLGYDDASQLTGNNMHALTHYAHADGSPYPIKECRVAHAFYDREGINVDNEVFWRSDGVPIPVEYWAYPILRGAECVGAVVTFLDISERRKTEEKLRRKEFELTQVIENMVDGVITIDETGTIYSFNRAAENIFAYRAEEVLGKNVNILMPEPDRGRHEDYINNYLKTGKGKVIGVGREVVALKKNGERFPMRLSVAELPAGPDGRRRFIGSCFDITHLKQQEAQLRRSQKMDALGKLTGGIAHDYNNMLAIIKGYAGMLQGENITREQQAGYLEEIDRACDRGSTLTSKLLSFSRQQSASAAEVDINALLAEDRHMLERTLTARIELRMELQDNLWRVWLDKNDLQDAILNLSINGSHAMEHGGRLVFRTENVHLDSSVASRHGLGEGEHVLLQISDTGEGMDEATLARIFDPFFTTKGDQGTGLGLSQVYGFINRSGGVIKVDSQPGHGTCFTMYFPRYVGVDDVSDRDPEQVQSIHLGGNETLLVVDDEAAVVNMTAEVLRRCGYTVYKACNGNEALHFLETGKVDLLLSDVVMPGMNGYQLAARVKSLYPDVKIQLMSGFSDDCASDDADRALQQKEIRKPFAATDLLIRLRQLLDSESQG
jgi:PAS domain S-box-containing protein